MIFRFNMKQSEEAQDMVRLLNRLVRFLGVDRGEVSRSGPYVILRINGADVEQRSKVVEFLRKSTAVPLLVKPLIYERREAYA